MREILFRGKRTDNGEWIDGYFNRSWLTNGEVVTEIRDIEEPHELQMFHDVDPATVGQYIGLTDRNGKRIFEGDIVKHYNDTSDSTIFSTAVIFWDEKDCSFMRTSDGDDPFRISRSCVYEVIGNIHDNPELLDRRDA